MYNIHDKLDKFFFNFFKVGDLKINLITLKLVTLLHKNLIQLS